ncbi:MAG: ABC transporter ATP-binding protein [Gammaproteobacteria bacterium]|nr:ABC transporter ATP-binding protein [Gammaproteobacteria bacterium]
MSESALLHIDNITTSYGPIEALHKVSLQVEEGELVAIVGANGAGKSTLLRTLSALIPPKSGTIHFAGEAITALPPHQIVKRGICQVPEGRELFRPLTVEDNLLLGSYALKGDEQWVTERLAAIYTLFPILYERRRQAAGTLSGGQQQMLAIGRALLGRPRLLLLDEPSMGLSPLLVEEIFRVITTLNREGVTILLVEQNARMALTVANRGYVLETGRVVATASAHELLQDDAVRRAYLGY